ncbi:MAG TPA: succinate dehydrogenase cytochrome b subunit [Tepidiformaceae bacterium]
MLTGSPPKRGATTPTPTVRPKPRRRLWLLEFYDSAVGKKAVMAVTGIILLGYVLAHMLGNLKIYTGAEHLNAYGEWLRTIGEPALPHKAALWIMRSVLILAFVFHIHAAFALTRLNRRARPKGYESKRDYWAANYASRTMRWSGVIVGLFIVFHLLDLTWGTTNPDFVGGQPYQNVVASFERWPVAIVYIVANLLLGLHIFHGAWSMFQSLGWNNPRFNPWRRGFAAGFAAIIVLGNVSFPVAVLTGIVD